MSTTWWSGDASVKGKQLDLWPELEYEWQMRHAYPRWRLITDYRPVLGLSLRGHLGVEFVNLVRFDYLRAHARIDGEPIEGILRQVVPEYGQVEEVQAAWDNTRLRLASVDQALQRVIHRLEAAQGYVEQAPSRRVFFDDDEFEDQGLQDRNAVRRLEAAAEELREVLDGSRFQRLREASEQVVEAILERRVTWVRVEPDALLGEFQPFSHTITIYPAMIRLVAAHPALQHLAPPDELVSVLTDLALLHEAAHAYVILGESCDRTFWRDYRMAPHRLHEALATVATDRMVERVEWLGDPRMMRIWKALRKLLPEEYREAERLLRATSGEKARRAVLRVRKPYAMPAIYQHAPRLLAAVHASVSQLARHLGRDKYEALRTRINATIVRIRGKQLDFAGDAYAELCSALLLIPVNLGIEMASQFEIEWPSRRKLGQWQRDARLHGPSVRTSALRLRLEWIDESPGMSANVGQGDRSNLPAIGLPGYGEIVKEAQRLGLGTPPEILRPRVRSETPGAHS